MAPHVGQERLAAGMLLHVNLNYFCEWITNSVSEQTTYIQAAVNLVCHFGGIIFTC